jgi:predicted AAA+ superfamily ATPase
MQFYAHSEVETEADISMTDRTYVTRTIEPVLQAATRDFPAVVLTGPRQAGKTTVLKRLFARTHEYVSLEALDVREMAAHDPRAFLRLHKPPVILDEVQQTPDLLAYIQEAIDDRRELKGQYVLSGSQNLLLLQHVSESLAGRAAILRLLPLSLRERAGTPARPLPWEGAGVAAPERSIGRSEPDDLWRHLLRGGFPDLTASADESWLRWHQSYVQTYLERDVRTVRQIGDLQTFQTFLRLLAARSAQLLNMTSLANELGLTLNTVKAWVSVLQASYQVMLLQPYHANVSKRLTKHPKVYFTDTGTLCYLVGLRDPLHAMQGPMAGAIVETAVVTELFKTYLHRGDEPRLWFWRTSRGSEVDIVVEDQMELHPIEVKAAATPRAGMAKGIAAMRDALSATTDARAPVVRPGFVVYTGQSIAPLGEGVVALPLPLL